MSIQGFHDHLEEQASQGRALSLDGVAEACRRALSLDGASVALWAGDGQATLGVSDARSSTLEDLQFTTGLGPAVEALRTGTPVLISDLQQDGSRWPDFTERARREHLRAVIALPLQVGAVRLGVLSLYRGQPGPVGQADLARMQAVADVVLQVLVDGDRNLDRRWLQWALTKGTARRAVVHQATGMVSAQLECPPADALARLRAHAYAEDRTVEEVAQDVVARRLRLD